MSFSDLSRRFLLKHSGVAVAAFGAAGWLGPAFLRRAVAANASNSKPSARKVLVCVFQRGAVDGLSMVVPHGDPAYYQHRKEIAIPRPSRDAKENSAAIDLDGYFGLHPLMSSLAPLYKSGQLAAIHACGSPSASRSHFDMQDFMESGVVDDKRVSDGWIGRMMEAGRNAGKSTPFRAVSMTSAVPRCLHGFPEALAIPDLGSFGVGGASGMSAGPTSKPAAGGFEGMYERAVGDVLSGAAKESFEAIDLLRKADPTKYKPAATYPQGTFAKAMMQVAQLIKSDVGLEVAFVDIDGWDTHINQGNVVGQIAGKLFDFSRALSAFHQDLGDRMDNVLLLTMSEFGRAARQNGNRGTDHGHGNCFLAMGGGVKGGKVYGDWPTLHPDKLFESRDLAVTTDYRDLFAEAAVRHLGIPADALDKVFPTFKPDAARFREFCKA